ncbi:MAG TPA: DUF308 domain-containing protein [Pseudolysinimonas sp.]|nr:DUF308 domain-containing protein [Pseudolysinimonas sp.]
MSAGSGTSAAAAESRTGLAAWVVPALRAIVALVVGFVITFTPAHSAGFGLVAFGLFAVVAGAIVAAGAFGDRAERRSRGLFVLQGALTVVAGVAALVLPEGGVHYFVWVVSAWAIVTGALELVSGIRARGRTAAARDGVILGGLTLILAIAFLVVPPDYRQALGGIEQVSGELTASVVLVGMFGAWAIVAGVLLGIAAVSARGPRPSPAAAAAKAAS